MAVRDTSIEAYHDMKGSGELSVRQQEVLAALERGRDYSRAEIAMASGLRLSSVCGRVNELIKLGRIAEAPIRACKVTGRTVHPVFRVP